MLDCVEIDENDFGIKTTINSNLINYIAYFRCRVFEEFQIFDLFKSIGLTTWIIIACFVLNIANKQKITAFLSIVPICIILTLCIATPVFSEFRYAYSSFTCIPLIIGLTFFGKKEEN